MKRISIINIERGINIKTSLLFQPFNIEQVHWKWFSVHAQWMYNIHGDCDRGKIVVNLGCYHIFVSSLLQLATIFRLLEYKIIQCKIQLVIYPLHAHSVCAHKDCDTKLCTQQRDRNGRGLVKFLKSNHFQNQCRSIRNC